MKYIFVNIIYHIYRILFIAVIIKNIVDMSGNKQFVKTRACVSFITRNRSKPRYR